MPAQPLWTSIGLDARPNDLRREHPGYKMVEMAIRVGLNGAPAERIHAPVPAVVFLPSAVVRPLPKEVQVAR